MTKRNTTYVWGYCTWINGVRTFFFTNPSGLKPSTNGLCTILLGCNSINPRTLLFDLTYFYQVRGTCTILSNINTKMLEFFVILRSQFYSSPKKKKKRKTIIQQLFSHNQLNEMDQWRCSCVLKSCLVTFFTAKSSNNILKSPFIIICLKHKAMKWHSQFGHSNLHCSFLRMCLWHGMAHVACLLHASCVIMVRVDRVSEDC